MDAFSLLHEYRVRTYMDGFGSRDNTDDDENKYLAAAPAVYCLTLACLARNKLVRAI